MTSHPMNDTVSEDEKLDERGVEAARVAYGLHAKDNGWESEPLAYAIRAYLAATKAADTIDRLTPTGEAVAYRTNIFENLPNGKLTRLILDATEVKDPDPDWKPLFYASPREGHVEVPVEPTEAIIRAAMDRLGWTTKPTPPEYENFGSARISDGLSEEDAARIDGELVEEFREVYRAMLAALQSKKPE